MYVILRICDSRPLFVADGWFGTRGDPIQTWDLRYAQRFGKREDADRRFSELTYRADERRWRVAPLIAAGERLDLDHGWVARATSADAPNQYDPPGMD